MSFLRELYDETKVVETTTPKKLYRGVMASGKGAGTARFGRGLYSSPNKSYVQSGYKFDKIIELTPEVAYPDNPLIIDVHVECFEDWLLRESGAKSMREFHKKWPDSAEFVKSKGFDGVVSGDDIVKY